jgi:asparagine N-glycosylation enzyme membrane subunit Stt3
MLSPTDIASLAITLLVMLVSLVVMLFFFSRAGQKNRYLIGWAIFANTSLLIWAVFHLFLDISLFPEEIVDLLHYWVTHSFIIVTSIVLAVIAKLAFDIDKKKSA